MNRRSFLRSLAAAPVAAVVPAAALAAPAVYTGSGAHPRKFKPPETRLALEVFVDHNGHVSARVKKGA